MDKKYLVTQTVTYYVHAENLAEAETVANVDAAELDITLDQIGYSRATVNYQVEEAA